MIYSVIKPTWKCNDTLFPELNLFCRVCSYEVVVRMKLTRSGRTVTKPAKFATSGVVDKVNVVASMVDNKVNVVAGMIDRVDSNVGLVVDKDGNKTRDMLQANQAKSSFLIPVELEKESEKATYIVRLPEKTEVERLKEEFMEVEEEVDDPMAQPEEEEKEKGDFSGGGVVFDGSAGENQTEADTINQFSLSHIPIEVIEEEEGGVDEEEFEEEDEEEEEREKTEEEEDWQEREEGRLSLVRQLGLLQEQQQREEEEISDHVISIEENGHITIEQVFNPFSFFSCFNKKNAQVHEEHSPPAHIVPQYPEWWRRISSTFLSFLSTGHLVDLWLVCSDGEAVPAHLLILAHASQYLSSVLANAVRDTQEEAVTLSLPDWDSHTVGQFVSALYQGQLPQGINI